MSVLGHGIDLVECERVANVFDRHGERFLARVLTLPERELAARPRDPIQFISGRWAAKEAILKMTGTGWRGQIKWTDIEILPGGLGQPEVSLTGETARIAADKGIVRVMLSITHTKQYAAASAIGVDR